MHSFPGRPALNTVFFPVYVPTVKLLGLFSHLLYTNDRSDFLSMIKNRTDFLYIQIIGPIFCTDKKSDRFFECTKSRNDFFYTFFKICLIFILSNLYLNETLRYMKDTEGILWYEPWNFSHFEGLKSGWIS